MAYPFHPPTFIIHVLVIPGTIKKSIGISRRKYVLSSKVGNLRMVQRGHEQA